MSSAAGERCRIRRASLLLIVVNRYVCAVNGWTCQEGTARFAGTQGQDAREAMPNQLLRGSARRVARRITDGAFPELVP